MGADQNAAEKAETARRRRVSGSIKEALGKVTGDASAEREGAVEMMVERPDKTPADPGAST